MATGTSCFFYGTLMTSDVLFRVIFGTTTPQEAQTASLRIRPAILQGYCRHKVRNVDYPGIRKEEGRSVRGTYVEGLTDAAVRRLDLFEGDEYIRSPVPVQILDPANDAPVQEVEGFTYVWNEDLAMLEPEEWDFEHFVKEKLHRWVADHKEYADVDKADPTGNRWWGNGFADGNGLDEQAEVPAAG